MADEMTFKHVLPVQIRFNDVDQYGHMNNSSYFHFTIWRRLLTCAMYSDKRNGTASAS